MISTSKQWEDKDMVFVKNITEFLNHVLDVRQLYFCNTLVKVNIDGGRGSLKICGSFIAVEQLQAMQVDGTLPPTPVNSVKDVFILGMVSGVTEPAENIKLLWEVCQLDDVKCIPSTDLKVSYILYGLPPHSSSHPCHLCNSLRSSSGNWSLGKLRTLGDIRQQCAAYRNTGSNLSKASQFDNYGPTNE